MNSSASGKGGARPEYDSGWRAAVVYFGLISFGLAQPLFETINIFRREFHFGLTDVAAVVFIFQYFTTAVLFTLRSLIKPSKLRTVFDCLVFTGAALMLIRQGQMTYVPTWGLQPSEKIIFLTAMTAGAVLAAEVFRRFLKTLVFCAGIVSPVFSVVFIYGMMNHSLPLKSGETEIQSAGADRPAVVLAVLDALSADVLRGASKNGIDPETFPNFARLASRGIQWRNAAANHPLSSRSFPSFLTSKLVLESGHMFNSNLELLPAENTFSIFKNAGYSVHIYSDYFGCAGRMFNCTSYLSGESPGFLLSTFFKFIETVGPDFIFARFLPALHGRRINTQHSYLTETLRTASPGEFHLVHLTSTHVPFIFTSGGDYQNSPVLQLNRNTDFKKFTAHFRDQTRYVDKMIGEALDAYDSRPENRPLILMLTSDHGGCWTPRCPGRADLDAIRTLEPSLVNVPAVLLSPFHGPRIDADDFQLIDVTPTLCEAAGLAGCGDYGFEGVPRLENPPPPRSRLFFIKLDRPPVDIPLPARPVPVPAAD